MSNVRKNLTILIILLISLLGCAGSAQERGSAIGLWKPEDCGKISAASGFFLLAAGDLLEKSDGMRNAGDEEGADKMAQGAIYFSQLAADYAKNFEAYCKR